MKILQINGSPRRDHSVSTQIANQIVARLRGSHPDAEVTVRDVYHDEHIRLFNEQAVSAYFTPPEDHTPEQTEAVKPSNVLATELLHTDILVLGVPMYNFSVSAGMKAYFDLVARAGITFNYLETGPVGVLAGKKAYIALVTGGTPAESPYDFTTGYVKLFLGFLGITDVSVVTADQLIVGGEEKIAQAQESVSALAL